MDIQVTVAIVSVSLAALLGSIGYLWKASTESLKSSRKILYYLLEVRYLINVSLINSSDIYERYIDAMVNGFAVRGLNCNREEIESLMGDSVRQHFSNISHTICKAIDEPFLTSYHEALLEFAQINPVLAYQLRGKESLQQIASLTVEYGVNLDGKIIPELPFPTTSLQQDFLSLSKQHRKQALIDLSTSLDEEILKVAKTCSIRDYLKCRKALNNTKYEEVTIDAPELEDLLDQGVAIIKNEIAKLEQQSES